MRERHRRGEGAKLRAEILDAVNSLLAEWGGAEKLTIRAVANEVGIAAPSVYLHFRDKADLVWSALEGKYQELADQMSVADRAADPADSLARLRAQAHAYCRFGLDHPGHYRLMFETKQPQVEGSRIRMHPVSKVSGSLREAVRRCRASGCALALPADQTAHTLWTGMHGTLSLTHSLIDIEPLPAICRNLADSLIETLVAAPGVGFHDQSKLPESEAARAIRAVLDGSYKDSST